MAFEKQQTQKEIDFRSESQMNVGNEITEDNFENFHRVAINSDTEQEDSEEDEELAAAKRVIFYNNSIRKSVKVDEDFNSESDY